MRGSGLRRGGGSAAPAADDDAPRTRGRSSHAPGTFDIVEPGPPGRRKRGRPTGTLKLWPDKAVSAIDAVLRLARMNHTVAEIAAFLEVDRDTLNERFKDDPAFAEAYAMGREQFKVSLRRLLMWHAQRPNASGVQMAIHLSKFELGMVEALPYANPRKDQGGEGGGLTQADLEKLPDDIIQRYIDLRRDILALPGNAAGGAEAPGRGEGEPVETA